MKQWSWLIWVLVAAVIGVGVARLLVTGMTHRSADQNKLIEKSK